MSQAISDIAVGRVIAERYRLDRQLGAGGMSTVWRATDLTLGSPVAIKFIDRELSAHTEVRGRFYAEARAAAALRSPHVVQTLDYGVDGDLPYIAMELLEGESLATRLERETTLPPGELGRIFADVGRAVRKAHEAGIVHRDLKPDNIFLVHNDDQEIAKILDFGIAKISEGGGAQRGQTRTGVLLGTLPYMSPEQAQGKAVDHRTDLWALGIIAFECLTGKRPFDSDNAGELIVQICANPIPVPSAVGPVPPGFDAWFARAATRDPEGRFQSVRELVDGLRAVLVPGASRMSLNDATVSAPSLPRIAVPEMPGAPGAAGPVSAARPEVAGGAAPAVTAHGPLMTMAGASLDGGDLGAPARPPAARRMVPVILVAAVMVIAPVAWLVTRPSGGAAAPEDAPAAPAEQVTVAPTTSVAPASPAASAAPAAPDTGAPAAPTAEPVVSAAPPASAAPVAKAPDKPRDKPAGNPAKPPPPPAGKRGKDSRIGF